MDGRVHDRDKGGNGEIFVPLELMDMRTCKTSIQLLVLQNTYTCWTHISNVHSIY